MSDWTKKDLAQFDRITIRLSSRDQIERITARLDLRKMEERLGKAALEEMFDVVKSWDAGEA